MTEKPFATDHKVTTTQEKEHGAEKYNPLLSIRSLFNWAIIPIQGSDIPKTPDYEDGVHFILVQHEDADLLDPGDTEIAVWIGDVNGNCKRSAPYACHIGDGEEFERWEERALEGRLINYLIEQWGCL